MDVLNVNIVELVGKFWDPDKIDWLIDWLGPLSKEFHWYRYVARRIWPLGRKGSLSCHTFCDTALVFAVVSEGLSHFTPYSPPDPDGTLRTKPHYWTSRVHKRWNLKGERQEHPPACLICFASLLSVFFFNLHRYFPCNRYDKLLKCRSRDFVDWKGVEPL